MPDPGVFCQNARWFYVYELCGIRLLLRPAVIGMVIRQDGLNSKTFSQDPLPVSYTIIFSAAFRLQIAAGR